MDDKGILSLFYQLWEASSTHPSYDKKKWIQFEWLLRKLLTKLGNSLPMTKQ